LLSSLGKIDLLDNQEEGAALLCKGYRTTQCNDFGQLNPPFDGLNSMDADSDVGIQFRKAGKIFK
jgi:hypothetical protein